MESRKIELTIEQAREFYKQGGKLKELALSAYTEKELMLPITERIKTFADAIKELGEGHYLVKEYEDVLKLPCVLKDTLAYFILRIICAALNEGWEPKFTKDECRYTPYFIKNSKNDDRKPMLFGGIAYCGADESLVFVHSYYSPSSPLASTLVSLGSRLCLKSKELTEYCGRQFIHFWEDYLLKK